MKSGMPCSSSASVILGARLFKTFSRQRLINTERLTLRKSCSTGRSYPGYRLRVDDPTAPVRSPAPGRPAAYGKPIVCTLAHIHSARITRGRAPKTGIPSQVSNVTLRQPAEQSPSMQSLRDPTVRIRIPRTRDPAKITEHDEVPRVQRAILRLRSKKVAPKGPQQPR